MIRKLLIALTATIVGALTLTTPATAAWQPPTTPAPLSAPPGMKVATLDPGQGGVRPTSVTAWSNRTLGDTTPVVVSSATPAVCSFNAATGRVTMLSTGTCTIAADQAASVSYLAGHVERSFVVTRL